MKKCFAGFFMLIAILALCFAGGDAMTMPGQIWNSFICVAIFAVSLKIVEVLST